MPFERYLRDDAGSYYYDDHYPHTLHPDQHALHFQIPHCMLNGPPILAPGGGAEVLPAGFLDSPWLANNGFAPFPSALLSAHARPAPSPPETANANAAHLPFTPHPSQRFHSGCPDPPRHTLPQHSPSLDAATYLPTLPSPSAAPFSPASCSALVPISPPPPPPSAAPTSSLGLSVYSASGFDVLSILSRVATRPNPTVQLGPVDFSCSFVIVDVRRFDSPIVYASPTFCHLTGYSEQEVLGRNCRFLQSPTGNVPRSEHRPFASTDAVSYMRKSLSSSKECQTTLVNYRKGGQAFINLVTVLPLRGGVYNTPQEADEVAYHIGFQVDLTTQPSRILDKLRDSAFHDTNTSGKSSLSTNLGISHSLTQLVHSQNTTNVGTKGGRHGPMMSMAVSKHLKNLLADTTFTDSVLVSTGTNMSATTNASAGLTEQANHSKVPLTMFVTPSTSSTCMNRMSASGNTMAGSIPATLSPSLSLLLLEFLPDFLLVLSLKGAFLYVAPSVRLVLGYEPEELVGRSISDVCHPADLVPLMRELKEGSVNSLSMSGTHDAGPSTASNLVPKSVDLLFRALPKVPSSPPSSQMRAARTEQDDLQHCSSSSSLPSRTLCSKEATEPSYMWLECRGRLHVEPGKGRKAIILSGRARWMPVVRWGSIHKADGRSGGHHHKGDIYGGSLMTTGLRLSQTSSVEAAGAASTDPLEFWALLSSQGTFLVASASVRDVLGWGTSEMIGRNIWAMVRDSRSGMRECVEAELSKMDDGEANAVEPPPTVVTTSLMHREFHVIPVRLIFYRTPRSRNHAPPSTSSDRVPRMPLIHPVNNPLCPIVCQAMVLSNAENLGSNIQVDAKDDLEAHPCDGSLFEELESARGSSWQYELQQLKYANQRLQEEVNALEESCGTTGSCSAIGAARASFGQPGSTLSPAGLQPTQLLQSLRAPNSLHEQDPPPSEWSSLAGANGQGPTNPLKRSWCCEVK